MDENAIRLLLKDQSDAFTARLIAIQAELQETKNLLQVRHGGGGDSGSALPRAMRLDVPKFNGTDPDSLIFSITEYFALLNTPVDQRLKVVTVVLFTEDSKTLFVTMNEGFPLDNVVRDNQSCTTVGDKLFVFGCTGHILDTYKRPKTQIVLFAAKDQSDRHYCSVCVSIQAELQETKILLQVRHGGGGDSGSALPRAMRLDVPKFNGTDPILDITITNTYFIEYSSDQRLNVVKCISNLEGEARKWFPLRMTGTTSSPIGTGLKPNLQRELLVAKPTTLGEVFALARVTEARLMDQQSGTVITTTPTSITSQPKPATPRFSGPKTDVGKPPLLPTPTSVSSNIANKRLAIKWISLAERQEHLNKGLCFICDNKWARGHKCPGKFLLLMAEDGDGTGQDMEADATDTAESGDISILNSLIGHGSPRSLQLWGTTGSGEVHVLIDNGSTHNFVQPGIVERMCLPVQTTKAFKVYIGSGESLLCENMCSQVTLSMQGLIMEVDLYVLPMKGPDVVLGIQWLQKLGKVTHDYAKQTMEFTLVNTKYSLQGDESLRMKKISLHHMQALLETEDVYGVYECHGLSLEAEGVATTPEVADPVHPELEQLLTQFDSLFQSHRFWVDYRALNAVTVKDKFPIPTADEMFDELGGAVTCKLDLREGHGVEIDPKKVFMVREWPVPQSQRHVRGFLGLVGYYRRFIKEYATLAAPLTDLLWKDGFKWGDRVSEAFEALKQQLSTVPVLGLPDFKKTFTVETDALGDGIGVPLVLFMEELKKEENQTLEELMDLHRQLDLGDAADGFRREGGLVIFPDRYFIGMESKLKSMLL
ncbi:reverse transcriptase [Tanacetum coccineum]